MKKKPKPSKKGLYIVIGIGITIITLVVATSYYVDQARIAGQRFGTDLGKIQLDLDNQTSFYESERKNWLDGKLTKKEILTVTEKHIGDLENIETRYDELDPPQPFISSVELFKRSTQAQIESNRFLKQWIETGDDSHLIKSNELMQQSFEFETSALNSYNQAKKEYTP